MTSFLRPYKFSGMIPPADELHAEVDRDALEIAPAYVHVPGGKKVAQYAPTIVGCALGYNPAQDCRGYFTSSKFQANNNCYNYACSIASNSYAQPGRLQGFFLQDQGGPTGAVIVRGAKIDGLLWIGRASLSVADLRDFVSRHLPGHVAALFISPSDNSVEWTGDYHWVRCDDGSCMSWSQKDGSDQVTDFDFAGNKIQDPRDGVWKVNQGPRNRSNPIDVVVDYELYGFMFVPAGSVTII